MNPAPPVIRICIEGLSLSVAGVPRGAALAYGTEWVSSKGSSTARDVAHHRRVAHVHMRGCAYSDMHFLTSDQIELIAARSRALGDTTRVRILIVLEGGEQAVGQIAEAAGTQQSTASKHLQVLFRAGLVQRRRAAATVLYRITSRELLKWLRYLGGRREFTSSTRPRMRTVRAADIGAASARRGRR
jgi:DNA-binding transcriptional ArsR family regulator